MIKYSYITQQGTYHEYTDRPCQDAVKHYEADGTFGMCVSDGAGSKKQSEIASEMIAEIMSKYIVDHFDELYPLEPKEIKSKVLQQAQEALKHLEIPYIEASCTMQLIGISGDQYIHCHIGDGGTVVRNSDGVQVMSYPENGEEKNITYFLNDITAENHLRIQKGTLKNSDILITTDGCWDIFYDAINKTIAPAVEKIMEINKNHETIETESILQKYAKELFSKYTGDDMGIGVLSVQMQ